MFVDQLIFGHLALISVNGFTDILDLFAARNNGLTLSSESIQSFSRREKNR